MRTAEKVQVWLQRADGEVVELTGQIADINLSSHMSSVKTQTFGSEYPEVFHLPATVEMDIKIIGHDMYRYLNEGVLFESKSLEQEWKCIHCDRPNLRKEQVCLSCGAPRPFVYGGI